MLASYDIVIVGGGPAGLSAAIYGRRAERSVLVLEKNGFGGQIAWSPKVDNFPGIPEISGAELADRMFAQALDMGAQAELAEVTGLRREGKGFAVITPEGEYAAKTVILATGAQHRRLGVPREEELAGNGVCYCAVCDGAFYKDRPVAVAGGGDAALQDALLLSNGSSKVYIIHRRDEFRAEAANVRAVLSRGNITCLMNSRVVALEGEGELSGIVVEDKATLGRAHGPGDRAGHGRRAPEHKGGRALRGGGLRARERALCGAGAPGRGRLVRSGRGLCRGRSGHLCRGGLPGQDGPPAHDRRGRRRGRSRGRLPAYGQALISGKGEIE